MQTRKDIENKITEYWKENSIFEKSVDQRSQDDQYVFYDGPPFATGTPHYGHILGMTSKDLFPRFWTMKGKKVLRRWGWDCHGLPIENIVEKELNIENKKQIENEIGIDKFNETCRSKVLYFVNEWKKTVDDMGRWIDFENSYKTMDQSYMETIWWIFKHLYDEGYVYKGKKVLMYCPRCQTPLSNAEIQMDNSYKDVTETTATVKFKVKDQDNTFVLAWTTTPWTLIGNVALAVNETLDYVKIEFENQKLILVKDRLEEYFKDKEYTVIEEFKGSELLHKEYEPLYEVDTKDKKAHYIINGGTEVTSEDGTGIVHMAAYGEFDCEMIKKFDLPMVQHVGNNGEVVDGPDHIKGLWFKDADKKVLEDLEERNLLFLAHDYNHSYPFCYRCETPLFYNALDSWFIDVQKVKEKNIEKNEDINWYPNNLKHGRFKKILETAPDWNISRNRYWATAIPVWECEECKHTKIIGSIKELQENAIQEVSSDIDLHKHNVDKITLKCEKCNKEMKRIPEVFDCWLESSSMPYAAKHYPFENKDWFNTNYPADFISEYIAQTRTWFNYMHVLGVLLFDKAPFKNVSVTGTILASDGQKMSKSKGNYPDPSKIFEEYGADTLRFYLMSSVLMKGSDINFNEDTLKEVYKKVIMLLSNVKSFYSLFCKDNTVFDNNTSSNLLDKWIISKLNLLNKNVTTALENYNTVGACKEVTEFIDNLSTWYVRRSRDRFKSKDNTVKTEAVQTFAYVLNTLAKVMAPITPFISEEIYLMFKETNKDLLESVHLELWPKYNEDLISEDINNKMDVTREIVSKALNKREEVKIPIKQPLNKLTINCSYNLDENYQQLIEEELNIKNIEMIKTDENTELKLELDTVITPELLQERLAREIVRKINGMRKKSNLTIANRIKLFVDTDSENIKIAIDKFNEYICNNIQADSIEFKKDIENSKEIKLEEDVAKLGFAIINL